MNKDATWNKYPFLRHAVIHLPPLRGEDAHDAICLLEEIIKAIWQAHGTSIADYRAMMDIETPESPDSHRQCSTAADDGAF